MLELRVIRVLYNYIKEISVNVTGIISKEPKNKLNVIKLYIKDFRVDDEVAIDLRVLVDIFLLAYSDILIRGRKLFEVYYDSLGSIPGRPN